jgi:hypothetical protein
LAYANGTHEVEGSAFVLGSPGGVAASLRVLQRLEFFHAGFSGRLLLSPIPLDFSLILWYRNL